MGLCRVRLRKRRVAHVLLQRRSGSDEGIPGQPCELGRDLDVRFLPEHGERRLLQGRHGRTAHIQRRGVGRLDLARIRDDGRRGVLRVRGCRAHRSDGNRLRNADSRPQRERLLYGKRCPLREQRRRWRNLRRRNGIDNEHRCAERGAEYLHGHSSESRVRHDVRLRGIRQEREQHRGRQEGRRLLQRRHIGREDFRRDRE